jgi:hypothetical protein
MPSPDEQVLRWAARAAGPSARVVSATGMRAGGNPWLLRLAGAGSIREVVLKTGDATADLTAGSSSPRSRRWNSRQATPCLRRG